MGAVHDFVSLSGSLRHEGEVDRVHDLASTSGRAAKHAICGSRSDDHIGRGSVRVGCGIVFNAYPQVVTASLIYIRLALVFGIYLYQFNGLFIPERFYSSRGSLPAVWVGLQYPLALVGDYPAETIVLLGGDGSCGELPPWR